MLIPLRVKRTNVALLRVLIFSAIALAGCLQDTITGPQVVPRLVLQPFHARFIAINYQAPTTGDMIVRWTRSQGDTQLNFKGYFVKLWSSSSRYDSTAAAQVETFLALRDTGSVYRKGIAFADTSITFKNIAMGRYTAVIWAVHSSDTLQLSLDSLTYSDFYDPRPLTNPSNLQVCSVSPTTVKLHWALNATDTNQGCIGYAIYARDPENTSSFRDSARRIATVLPHIQEMVVPSVPFGTNTTGSSSTPEHTNIFFVRSLRNDSTIFWGAADSNLIKWAGAQPVPTSGGTDTGTGTYTNSGFRIIRHSMYFGTYGSQFDLIDDSAGSNQQVLVSQSGSDVILTAGAGAAFLNGGEMVSQAQWDSNEVFYTTPLTLANGSPQSSVTLSGSDTLGRLVYLQFLDSETALKGKSEYARFFVRRQSNGSFINPNNGGIDVKGMFQPGVTSTGNIVHLLYY